MLEDVTWLDFVSVNFWHWGALDIDFLLPISLAGFGDKLGLLTGRTLKTAPQRYALSAW